MEAKTKEVADKTVKALGGDLEKKVVLNKTNSIMDVDVKEMEFVFRTVDPKFLIEEEEEEKEDDDDNDDDTEYDWEAEGFTLDVDDDDISLDPVQVRFPLSLDEEEEEKKDEEEDDVVYCPSRPGSPMPFDFEECYHSS